MSFPIYYQNQIANNMNNAEIWKDIPGYEGIYQVSDMGNVKSLSREMLLKGEYPIIIKEKILKPSRLSNGYLILGLSKNGFIKKITVHTLVAMVFLNHKPDGTNKICVDHINNIKTDNRLVNLQLISQRENTSKDKKNGTSKYVGVCWKKSKNKFEAQIKVDGKNKYLGLFTDEHEAHLVYQKALNEHKNKFTH